MKHNYPTDRKIPARQRVSLAERPDSVAVILDRLVYSGSAQRARPCACGGVVVAHPEHPVAGVAEHRETPRHRAWAEEWLS